MAAKSPECVFLRLDLNENGRIDLLSFGQLQKAMERATAICIGPGLGIDDDTRALVESVLEQAKCPVLLDADGINILSENINVLDSVTVPVVLTPHIGEMAGLLAVDSQSILNDRYELVGNFAKRYGVTVVCKGYRTFTAPAAMNAYMNTTGNAGLAKAGSGDLLSGMIGALLAQGLAPEKAAAAGVYYHGKAADLCQAELGKYAYAAHGCGTLSLEGLSQTIKREQGVGFETTSRRTAGSWAAQRLHSSETGPGFAGAEPEYAI